MGRGTRRALSALVLAVLAGSASGPGFAAGGGLGTAQAGAPRPGGAAVVFGDRAIGGPLTDDLVPRLQEGDDGFQTATALGRVDPPATPPAPVRIDLPTASPAPLPPDVLAGRYTSPTHGYVLEWDPAEWQAREVSTTEGTDDLGLSNGTSVLLLRGVAFAGTVEECRDELIASLSTEPGFAGFAPTQDLEFEGRDSATFAPIQSWATFSDGEWALYVDCLSPVVPGQPVDYDDPLQGVYVQTLHAAPSASYAEERVARRALLSQITPGP